MPYGYLIEIKYINRGELTERSLEKAEDDAKKQLSQYAAGERFATKYRNRTILKLLLVYHGWEMVRAKEV